MQLNTVATPTGRERMQVPTSRTVRPGNVLVGILKYTVLLVLAFSFVLPFYWMVSSALKNNSEVFSIPPVWFPPHPLWENFSLALRVSNFALYFTNTVVRYAIPVTVALTLSSAFIAYGFSHLRWPGRDVLFSICMVTMMVPGEVTMVPLFIVFKRLGWINTYLPLVVPGLTGSPYYIFLLRQFFLTLPPELSDAAKIDGAGEFAIFFRIVLPLAKPALTVVALFSFMGAWNDYFGPLVYLNREKLYPVALAVYIMRLALTNMGKSEMAYPYLMAVSTVVTLPIIIGFFLAQRTFIEGISLTGLKG